MTDKSASDTEQTSAPKAKLSDPITLAEPIRRGDSEIASIVLRKPKAGELRGLSIQELMNARATATLDLLPRISMPPITQPEADGLEPEDLAACSGAIIDFFLTPADRTQMKKMLRA